MESAPKSGRRPSESAEAYYRRTLDRSKHDRKPIPEVKIKVGPRMQMAVDYVKKHPGSSQKEIAQAIGQRGIATYGREVLLRAIAAGLIRVEKVGRQHKHYAVLQRDSGSSMMELP